MNTQVSTVSNADTNGANQNMIFDAVNVAVGLTILSLVGIVAMYFYLDMYLTKKQRKTEVKQNEK